MASFLYLFVKIGSGGAQDKWAIAMDAIVVA
jgi:hypothetical protein